MVRTKSWWVGNHRKEQPMTNEEIAAIVTAAVTAALKAKAVKPKAKAKAAKPFVMPTFVPVDGGKVKAIAPFFTALKVGGVFKGTYTTSEGKANPKEVALAYPYNPASNKVWVSAVVDGHTKGKPYPTRLDRWVLA